VKQVWLYLLRRQRRRISNQRRALREQGRALRKRMVLILEYERLIAESYAREKGWRHRGGVSAIQRFLEERR
jgi:hypothetical protein